MAAFILIWDNGGAQSLADIIDALAKATPENRAAALYYPGQGAMMLAVGLGVLGRMIAIMRRCQSF